MGTRLHHLMSSNLDELEKEIESLSDKVEVRAINFVNKKWIVHFTIYDEQFWRPVTTGEDRDKQIKKG